MNVKSLLIRKRKFTTFVSDKIKKIVNVSHVFSVINILLDEISKDLNEGKQIKIYNFGTMELKKNESKPYFDINERKVLFSKGQRTMRFLLFGKIRNIIINNLDIDKTFLNN